jgi:AraC-like DNA-binding protein
MGSFAFERHYRVKELAGLWGLSPKTLTRIFADEVGVIRVANDGTGKRKYATLSIPESVAFRVHERLGNQPLQPPLGGQQLRTIRLRDLGAGASRKPRHVIKLKTAQELAAGECVR